MTLRGVLKIGGLAVGALVALGVAGFYLMPSACGCDRPPDPQRLVGLSGQEIATATVACMGLEMEPPREELTWWTVVGEPRLVDYTGPWSEDSIWDLDVVPYGRGDAGSEPLRVVASRGVLATDEPPAGTFTQHVGVIEEGDGSITAPLGIVETTWGAAYFTGDCADAGLRETRQGTLPDADVASWPSLTASEFGALYGPPPPEPSPITEESLVAEAPAPTGPVANASINMAARGEMPASDQVWLVTAWGLLHPEPITGLQAEPTTGVGAPVPVGEVVGVVLERDGRSYLVGTLDVPRKLPRDSYVGTEVVVDYTETQTVEPLGGGDAAVVPGVLARPFYAN